METVEAPVVENRCLNGNYFALKIESEYMACGARPGQFAMVKCGYRHDPLLRRPFSFSHLCPDTGRVGFVYEVRGSGTRWMRELKPGDDLDLLGPLGNGFGPGEDHEATVLIAGGMGVAPLASLAGEMWRKGREFSFFVGAQSKSQVLLMGQLRKYGMPTAVATEDGSQGFEGLVTQLVEKKHGWDEIGTVYACGPTAMLKEVKRLTRESPAPVYLSLEERMACGVGACLGCSVKDSQGGYLRVCADGPVFEAQEVVL